MNGAAEGRAFGEDLFRRAIRRWEVAVERDSSSAEDLVAQLRFFHVLGLEIGEHEHAASHAWRSEAEAQYRRDVFERARATVLRWKKSAPAGKRFFNQLAKEDTFPFAVDAILFPHGTAARMAPLDLLELFQGRLADLRRLAGH